MLKTGTGNCAVKYFLTIFTALCWAVHSPGQKAIAGHDSLAFVEETIRKVKKNVNFTIVPGPTANATQKLGFGVLPMIVYNLDMKDSVSPPSSTAVLFYFDFYGSWVTAAQQNFYWDQNNWRAIVFAGYGQMRIKYFGVGQDSRVVSSSEGNYVWGDEDPFLLTLTCYRKFISHLYGGLEYNYSQLYMTGKDSAATAMMTADGITAGKTIESSITPTFVWDSRDNIYWSVNGFYAGLSAQIASRSFASSHNYYVLTGFVNGYHRLVPGKDRLSLAWRFFIQGGLGDVPYDQMSNYCRGDKVKGYNPGKYVNYGELNGQVEVRYDIWKFIASGGFFSLGKTFGSLQNFGQSVWLPSGGVNLYITLIPYRNIRMSLSGVLARKDWGLYIGVGQMF